MKETVLITGGNGFVAKHISQLLEKDYQVRFLTREPQAPNQYSWDIPQKQIDGKALEGVDYIIHLSGSKIYDGKPLTEEKKQMARDTRIGAAELILSRLEERKQSLKAFISASSMDYYDYTDQQLAIDERGNQGNDFGAILAEDWEKAADRFKEKKVAERVVKLRFSTVLGKEGGMFAGMKNRLAKDPETYKDAQGNAYFPWVHIDDLGKMFLFAMQNKTLEGVFNTATPEATNQAIVKKLMYFIDQHKAEDFKQLNPSYEGKFMSSAKIVQAGFRFTFADIKSALQDLMQK